MSCFLVAVLILIFLAGKSDMSESRGTRTNYCVKLERYVEEIVVPETERVKETYTSFCWSSITLKCTRHRYNTVLVNKTIHVYKTKHVMDCCPGYRKENDVCIPICKLGCNHGECVEPDICLCKPGWKEPLCETECEPNRFGRGCKGKCTCFHGALCDQETGFCHCTEGFFGDQCQFPCPENTYGQDCKSKCECENDGVCDIVDGTCYCTPGYEGEFCEIPCKNGTHGQDCGNECICIPENTESCHHVDGKCLCKPGYSGEFCEKECDGFTYGPNCSKICSCLHSEFCDHINGNCYCKPGWKGATCSERCPFGTFGENCSFECTRCLNVSGDCDPVTGYCNCPSGRFGDLCDKVCLPGYWGSNCSNMCPCSPDESCDPVDGTCSWCNEINKTKTKEERNEEKKLFSADLLSSRNAKFLPIYVLMVSTAGIIAVLSIILFIYYWCKSKRKLEFRIYSPFHGLNVFRRLSKTGSSISGATHNNPVYEFNEVVLESENDGRGFIRGSFPGGVRYIKNNMNSLDAENKASNVEKTGEVTGEFKRSRSVPKDLSFRKTFVFRGVLKDVKRCSMRKTESTHSSTNELENDFQPEILEDFNVMENIYEKPKEKVIENIYEKPKENVIENIYEKPKEKVIENIYEKPVVLDDKNLSLKE